MTPERMAVLKLIYQYTRNDPTKGISIEELLKTTEYKANELLFIVEYLIGKGFARYVTITHDIVKITADGVDFYEFNTRVQ